MPWMIAHRMDLLAVHEMTIANAVPKDTPDFAISTFADMRSTFMSVAAVSVATWFQLPVFSMEISFLTPETWQH